MPKISVIVPVYNIQDYIDECVGSILAQTEPDMEVILVDDGSTDGSGEKCDAWVREDGRIQVVHQVNRGLRGALFTGLVRATAPYIGFVDGDDWVEPAMFATLLAAAEEHGADIVECGYIETGGGQPDLHREPPALRLLNAAQLKDEVLTPWLEGDGQLPVFASWSRWNKLYRKDMLCRAVTSLDPTMSIGEDLTQTLACLLICHRVVTLPGAAYYRYRRNPASMTRVFDPKDIGRYDPSLQEAGHLAAENDYTGSALRKTRDILLAREVAGVAAAPLPRWQRAQNIRAITRALGDKRQLTGAVCERGLPARLLGAAARLGLVRPALVAADLYRGMKVRWGPAKGGVG